VSAMTDCDRCPFEHPPTDACPPGWHDVPALAEPWWDRWGGWLAWIVVPAVWLLAIVVVTVIAARTA
jgi:hypothetical protein